MNVANRLTQLEAATAGGNGDGPDSRGKGDPRRDRELEALSLSVWPSDVTREEAALDLFRRLRHILGVAALHNGSAKATLAHLTLPHDVHGRPIAAPADAQWDPLGFVYLDEDGRQTDHFIRELHPRAMAFLPAYRIGEGTGPSTPDVAMREVYKWLFRVHLPAGYRTEEALQALEELERLNIVFAGVGED